MWWLIALLIVVGALMLVVELVLMPGITVAAIGALASWGGAGWLAWENFGVRGLLTVVAIVIALTVAATWFSLRARTWQRFALGDRIEGRSQEAPARRVKVGDRGVALGRLAPMGKVTIDGRDYEAKTTGGFVDQHTGVEVVGFENFNVIVKPLK
ncbi:MAG: NfeD family protein [Alistipes sp.]|jgi:membrane-bound ClpP family serine protease|nr:NfeD family protein [Alistipes sp.]